MGNVKLGWGYLWFAGRIVGLPSLSQCSVCRYRVRLTSNRHVGGLESGGLAGMLDPFL